MSCLLCGDGAEVKTGVCGTGDGRDLGKSEGRGDVVLHEFFYRITAKKHTKDGMWYTQTLTFQLVFNSILNV